MIQAVERALDIMDITGRAEDGVRLSTLAAELNLNSSTVHNLVRTLRVRGYLEQDSRRRYRLGAALVDLAARRGQQGLYRRAGVEMRMLHAAIPEATITFSELAGSEICCRLRMSPDLPDVIQYPRSQTFSVYGSASGLCLQVFSPGFRELVQTQTDFDESAQSYWSDYAAFEQAFTETARLGGAALHVRSQWRLAAPAGECHVLGLSAARLPKRGIKRILKQLCVAAARIVKECD